MTVTTPRKRAAKKTTPTGAARIPKRSQGFYRDPETGEKLRSVTTIINQGVPKEALIFWAGNIVARSAIDNLPDLVRASIDAAKREEMYDYLRRAHTRKKDERADIGSAVHRLVEAHILDQPMPEELLADEEMAPFLEQFLLFVETCEVTFTASEMVVANPGEGYAGTLDYMLRSPLIVKQINAALGSDIPIDLDLLGDTKTGGELHETLYDGKSPKGVYGEAGLQMAGYKHAAVCWLRDGSKVPMPPTADVGIVLHLRPDGFRVYPALCGDAEYRYFLHAKQVAEWTSQHSKTVLGQPLDLPGVTPLRKKGAA